MAILSIKTYINMYETRCRETDPLNYHMVFDQSESTENPKGKNNELKVSIINDEVTDLIQDFEDMDETEKDELDYIKNDPVRKFQFPYDKSVCLVDNHPEAALKENREQDINVGISNCGVRRNQSQTVSFSILLT